MNLAVYVTRRPDMFAVDNNMYNRIGYGELKNLYRVENYVSDHNKLTLYYPERFLNIPEQHALIERIESAGYEDVTIVTHSVYIVQTVHNTSVKILDDSDVSDIGFKLSNGSIAMPDDSGLNVI